MRRRHRSSPAGSGDSGRESTSRVWIALGAAFFVLLSGCAGPAAVAGDTASAEIGFEEVATETGLDYTPTDEKQFGNSRTGVYVTDFDNDGWPDVLATGGDRPVLFENRNGTFERSGALPPVEGTVKNALFFDYDRDGWEDLVVFPLNSTPVLLENRRGEFAVQDVGFDVRIEIPNAATAADYDHDGCLDLFVAQNGDWREAVPKRAHPSQGKTAVVEDDNGGRNVLFDGDCSSFEAVEDAGIEGTRWSLATSFVDLTGDGRPDIHVGNDYNLDTLYVNRGNGTFRPVRLPDTNRHAMSSEAADVTGDARLDLFVTNIHFDSDVWERQGLLRMNNEGNNLLVNRGNGSFEDRAGDLNVSEGGWGWAAALVDLDNDGDLDLLHTTQVLRSSANPMNSNEAPQRIESPPRLWERHDEGFERLNGSARGLESSDGRGMANLDYDRDGDQDVVVAGLDGFRLYENQADSGNWLQMAVVDGEGSLAIGSEVYVTAGGTTRYRVEAAKADFLSQDTRYLHVGLGDASSVDVRVVWPDGRERTFEDVAVNRRLVVSPTGPPQPAAERGEN